MKIRFITIMVVSVLTMGFKSDKPAYSLFNSEGKQVKYSKMMKDLAEADIVFFGELHNNPIAHWLELEITKDLYTLRNGELVLAAEMFERDDQLIIDEYLSAYYDASKFEPEVKLWKNYKTDYKPLMEFAKDSNLYFIASNVPRRYASMVSKKGFEILDTLSEKAKTYVAPLPIEYDPEVKSYKDMLDMMRGGNDTAAHVNDNLPKAQALKDATMAYSIKENWSEGKLMIHYNGSYHSRNFEGIIWYLNRYMKGLNIVTIETVNQQDINNLSKENMGVASYIIAVPSNMTSTY
jgi:uncharacterized iron-regulated protein